MNWIEDCLKIAKEVVTPVIALAGVLIAKDGLFTWKRQIKGTKEFDAAYNLNYSVLKLRDEIKRVRRPAIWAGESYEAIQWAKTKYPNMAEKDVEKESHAFVYQKRWEEITKCLTEIDSHILAAELLWDKEIIGFLKPLNKKVTELNLAIQQNLSPEIKIYEPAKMRDIIYNKGDENNEDDFTKEVEEMVQEITDYLKGKIA